MTDAGLSVAGVTPARVLAPADRRQLASMVRELSNARRSFAFVGGGTDLDFGNAPRALDAVIRTGALAHVLAYAPEDQTITVEAGMRIADLDAILAEHAQVLPIDVGDRTYATIGGAIATNAFGARRHRYGSIKDLIVGVDIVRPDGVVARGGGTVVKNVAGFDLPKVMVGSLGTLGAVVAATFRVFPRPEHSCTLALDALPASASYAAIANDRAVDAAAVTYAPREGLVLTLAGFGAAVTAQRRRVEEIAARHDVGIRELDDDAIARAGKHACAVRARGPWRAAVAHAPAAPAPIGVPDGADSIAFPTLGVTLMASSDDLFPPDAIERARAAGSMIFHALPGRARGAIDAWGPPPPAFGVMRALKAAFDPHGVCNPGRFVGGL